MVCEVDFDVVAWRCALCFTSSVCVEARLYGSEFTLRYSMLRSFLSCLLICQCWYRMRTITCGLRLMELLEMEISCAKVCHLEVDAAHSWVDWTLPVSKTDVRDLGKVRRWECVYSGDFTKPCPFHAIVVQLEILRSLHGGSGGIRRFGGHSLRVTGARLMAGMGFSIVLIQLMARWSFEAVLRYVAEAPL